MRTTVTGPYTGGDLTEALRIARPDGPEQFASVAALFRAYLDSAVFAWDADKVAVELAALDQKYRAPDGALLLAQRGGQPVGAVGLRRHDETRAEMKRLYVPPWARGLGVGRALVEAIVGEAAALGFRSVVLDTYTRTPEAIALYLATGFREIEPWCFNAEHDTRFFERLL